MPSKKRLCPVGMRLFVASTKTIRKISIQFHSKAPMSPSSSRLRRSPSTIIGAAGVPVVSGTTGWLEHLPEIREACEKGQTFFYASNFSLGVNIFFAVNKYLAGIMNHFPQYSVEIEEIHHIHKLDHPSGTAITLAEDIIGQLDAKHSWSENMPVADDSIHITARREGEIPGTHTVAYDSAVDTIRITHEAKNRKGFALGAVVAAEFTVGKKGFLTMQDLFSFLK